MRGRVRRASVCTIGLVALWACEFGSAGKGEGQPLGSTGEASTAPVDDTGAPVGTSTPTSAGEGTADGDTAQPTTSITSPPIDETTTTTPTDDGTETGSVVLPGDCAEILAANPGEGSGVFTIAPPGSSAEGVEVYCDMQTDGGGWTRFWWWTPGTWPAGVADVLGSPFGTCDPEAPYCFGRLPAIPEDGTSLYAFDPQSVTKYRWDFDSQNGTAHAAWRAFAEHMQVPAGEARDGDPWSPMALEGSPSPDATQDSFQYRSEHGVASVMLDDDNCDCETTLQMGHGMCYGGWGTGSSPENSYGVDRLHNPGVEIGPQPTFHLELFYR